MPLASCVWALLAVVAAEPASVPRVVIAGPVAPALWARVQGQTGDLDWQLDVVTRPADVDLLDWAAAQEAAVVLAFERTTSAWDVSVLGRARERRLVRRVPVPPGALGESSAHETVAVLVRGLLVALSQGEAVVLEPSARPDEDAAVAPWLAAGAEVAWAGVPLYGVRAQLGLATGAWRLALEVASGPARALDDGRTTLSLARHTVLASAGLEGPLGATLSAGGGLRAGVLALQRSVVVVDPTLSGTAPRLVPSLLVGAELQLTWWLDPALGLRLSGGLDVAPAAPELVYRLGDEVVTRTDVAVLQPRVGLTIVVGSLTRSGPAAPLSSPESPP